MTRKLLFITLSLSFYFQQTFSQSPGNALDFDGSNDQVVCPLPAVFSNIGSNDFTIEAWVYPRASLFTRIVFAQLSATNFANISFSTVNTIYFYVVDNGTNYSIQTSGTLPLNQWSHVAARWKAASNTVEVFFNGVLQGGVTGGTSTTGSNNMLTIGARPGGSQFFQGTIDEVKIWNTARSQCAIAANRNASLTGSEANLVAYYKFDHGVAGGSNAGIVTLNDFAGTHNGTLNNFALSGVISNWIGSSAVINLSGLQPTNSYNIKDTVSLCSGGSYTFHDGITENNITVQTVHISSLLTVGLCDSIIETTVLVDPVYNITEAVKICPGDNYNFPDGTTQNNITTAVSHISNLQAVTSCDSNIITNITFNPIYDLEDTVVICNGTNYTFPDGTIQNNITDPTSHTSILLTVTGCDSTIVTNVEVSKVNAAVTQSGATLSAHATGSYQWLNCDDGYAQLPGATNKEFVATANGNYAVEILEKGCTDTSVCNAVTIIGVQENNLSGMVKVFPNPSAAKISIDLGSQQEYVDVEITNVNGKVVFNQEFGQSQLIKLTIDQPAGIYFLLITTNTGNTVVRVVKE